MNAKQALVILIAGTAAIRLLCAVSLGLGNDEAYHSLYAAHPALSYFDHPPMMAWVEMAGLALSRGVTARLGPADRLHRAVCRIDAGSWRG